MSNYKKLLKTLNVDKHQKEILENLYQEVGSMVGDLLLSANFNSPNFQVYDVVDVAVNEVLEGFRAGSDFPVLESLFNSKLDEVVAFLKDGYGSPQEIFDSYREILG